MLVSEIEKNIVKSSELMKTNENITTTLKQLESESWNTVTFSSHPKQLNEILKKMKISVQTKMNRANSAKEMVICFILFQTVSCFFSNIFIFWSTQSSAIKNDAT